VVDAAGGGLYGDGVQKATRAWTGVPAATTSAQAVNLGLYSGATGSPYFAGSLDEVRIYNRALSAQEIVALAATADTLPPTVAITAPPAGSIVGGTVTGSATATDNGGARGIQVPLDRTTPES